MARKDIINQNGVPNWDAIAGFKERLDGHDGSLAQKASKVFVTPEEFGAVGKDTTDDTTQLQSAINYAIANKIPLKSSGSQTYRISSPLQINGYIDIDFGGSIIKTSTQINSLINVDGSDHVYYGKIQNISLNCSNTNYGIYFTCLRKRDISNLYIYNFSGTGIHVASGSSAKIHDCHFKGNSATCIGINVQTSDMHLSDMFMIDCHTAIINNGTNFYERIHAWMWGRSYLPNSLFMDIVSGRVFMSQMYPDTYAINYYIRDDLTSGTNIPPTVYINEMNLYYNTIIMSQTDLTACGGILYVFKFDSLSGSARTYIQNAYITGVDYTSLGDSNSYLSLSNLVNGKTNINFGGGIRTYKLTDTDDKLLVSDSITLDSAVTNISNNITYLNNSVQLELNVQVGTALGDNPVTIGTLPAKYRPRGQMVFTGQYGYTGNVSTTQFNGTLTVIISSSTGLIQVRALKNDQLPADPTRTIFIHVTWLSSQRNW